MERGVVDGREVAEFFYEVAHLDDGGALFSRSGVFQLRLCRACRRCAEYAVQGAAHLVGSSDGEDAPAIKEDDLLTKSRLRHVGGRAENGKAGFSRLLLEDFPQFAPRQGVDAGGRLVEQQEVGRAHEGAEESELLLHAARKIAREPTGERSESRHVQEAREALVPLFLLYAVQIGVELHVFLDGQIFVETELLRHVAEAALHLLRLFRDIVSEDEEIARRLVEQPRDEPQQCRLACAVRADERRKLACGHREVKTSERRDGAGVLRREGLDECRGLYDGCVFAFHRSTCTFTGMPRRRRLSGSSTEMRTS